MRQLQPHAKSNASSTVLRARCSTLSEAVPIPLAESVADGEAPEIQKSVDGFVESEPHRKSPAMAMSAPPRESRLRTVSTVSSCAPEGGSRNPSYSANAARSRSRIAAASGRAASLTVIPPNLFNFQAFDVEPREGTDDGPACVLYSRTLYGLFETAYLRCPGA